MLDVLWKETYLCLSNMAIWKRVCVILAVLVLTGKSRGSIEWTMHVIIFLYLTIW